MTFLIVVIDDDPAIQEFYRLLLASEGYKVMLLPPSTFSPASIAALHPDLIILDLLLGGHQSGWPILQALASDPQTVDLPVLLVTVLPLSDLETEWQAFIEKQHIPLITKPFDIDALLATIRSLLPDTPSPSSDATSSDPVA